MKLAGIIKHGDSTDPRSGQFRAHLLVIIQISWIENIFKVGKTVLLNRTLDQLRDHNIAADILKLAKAKPRSSSLSSITSTSSTTSSKGSKDIIPPQEFWW